MSSSDNSYDDFLNEPEIVKTPAKAPVKKNKKEENRKIEIKQDEMQSQENDEKQDQENNDEKQLSPIKPGSPVINLIKSESQLDFEQLNTLQVNEEIDQESSKLVDFFKLKYSFRIS